MQYELFQGDCVETMRAMPDNSVDSIVTDPPYELGFMGKAWDASGIANNPVMWAEALRVLKPGGHLLAFSGSRTYHRMTCAIEDAGFEVRDQIMWVYGSGFPKSLDVSKAIDKAAGVSFNAVPASGVGFMNAEGAGGYNTTKNQLIRSGESTDAARQWEGWGTALKPAHEPICVARKPLKSLDVNVLSTVELGIRDSGFTGEITWKSENVSAAKSKKQATNSSVTPVQQAGEMFAGNAAENGTPNAVLQTPNSLRQSTPPGEKQSGPTCAHTTNANGTTCVTKCSQSTGESALAVERLRETSLLSTTSTGAEQNTANQITARCSLNSNATASPPGTECFAGIATGLLGSMAIVHITRDSDGAFIWPRALPKFVEGGALTVAANVLQHGTGALNIDGCRVEGRERTEYGLSNSTRSAGNTYGEPNASADFDSSKGRWPANLIHDGSDEVLALFPVTTSGKAGANPKPTSSTSEGWGNIGSTGHSHLYGDTGSAARFFYCAKTSKADRGANSHPTVKPTELMAYLCRLVTPPGGLILDPFMGSGSTGKAAMREGFRFIGCELSAEYLAIAEARISHELIGDLL